MSTEQAPNTPRGAGWWWRVLTAASALVSIAAIWWLAWPRHEICIAIYPAPPGCGTGRVAPAIVWTIGIALAASVGLILARGRPARSKPWVGPGVAVVIVVVSLIGYWFVYRA